MKIPAPNYTQTPNDLFDHWLPHLNEGELKVLLVILRKTFGWHKNKDRISISQLAKITGLHEETVVRATRSLQSKGVISKEVVGPIGKQETYYALIVSEDSNNSYPSDETRTPLGSNPPVQSEAQKKDIYPKETIQKKQQQTAAPSAAVFSDKENHERQQLLLSTILKDVQIPEGDKIEIIKKYSDEQIKHALLWVSKTDKPIKSLPASLKWACKNKPEIPKTEKDITEENKKYSQEMYQKCKETSTYRLDVLNKGIEVVQKTGSYSFHLEYTDYYFKEKLLEEIKRRKLI
jgi:phage replication O-like protein O